MIFDQKSFRAKGIRQTAKAAVAASPDIREELTADIRERVQNGTYHAVNTRSKEHHDA